MFKDAERSQESDGWKIEWPRLGVTRVQIAKMTAGKRSREMFIYHRLSAMAFIVLFRRLINSHHVSITQLIVTRLATPGRRVGRRYGDGPGGKAATYATGWQAFQAASVAAVS